jgi:hypothetical protein
MKRLSNSAATHSIYKYLSTKEFLNELVQRFPKHPPPWPCDVKDSGVDTWMEGWYMYGIMMERGFREY